MQAHKNLGGLSIFTPFLKLSRKVFGKKKKYFFFAKSIKIFQQVSQKQKPLHFHNTCFYQKGILGKQATGQAKKFKFKLATGQNLRSGNKADNLWADTSRADKNLLCKKTWKSFKSPLKLPSSS